jgi:amphiphysin
MENLYNPIVGAGDGYQSSHEPMATPATTMARTTKLKDAYAELKTDMLEEVARVDARILKPATDAKDYIQPLKKTIKKRENKRLDYERYQDRVNNAHKKIKKSERDHAALAKAEEDLSKATDVSTIVRHKGRP